jgi:hypothetical protein
MPPMMCISVIRGGGFSYYEDSEFVGSWGRGALYRCWWVNPSPMSTFYRLFKDFDKTAQVLRYCNELPIGKFRKSFDILKNIFRVGWGSLFHVLFPGKCFLISPN